MAGRWSALVVARSVLQCLGLLSGVTAAYGFMSQFGWFGGFLPFRQLPDWLQERVGIFRFVASTPVLVHEDHWQDTPAQLSGFGGGGVAPEGWGEYSGGTRAGVVTFWDPGFLPLLAWALLLAVPIIAVGVLWFVLGRMVSTAVDGDPFTRSNASRLVLIGSVLLVGPYAFIALNYLVRLWMLSSSTVAGKVDAVMPWSTLPLWPLGAGIAVLALAATWRVGVRLRDDVAGLV
jgi:hypothetical protein